MLFNPEINSIEEDILYHETQITEAQERLDQVKMSAAFSNTVISSLEDFFENTDPFLYEVLKGHINQMFDENKLTTNNEVKQVKQTPQEIIKEEPQPEKTEKEEPQEAQATYIEKIDGSLVYDHDSSTCHVAFKAKGRADSYGSYLTRILDIAEKYTVNNKPSFFETKYELRVEGISFDDALHLQDFNLLKEYSVKENEEAREVWSNRIRVYETSKPRPKALDIADVKFGAIVSTSADDISKKQYKVLAHKELNGEQHLEVICIFNREMPALVNISSWLKEVYPVELGDIKVDPQFNPTNFQKEDEVVLTEDVNIYIPKETVKKSEEIMENDFPPAPYTELPLSEVEFGDVITSSPHGRSAYMVKEHAGEFVMAECLYNKSLPGRVGEDYSFSKIYLVEKCSQEVAV